MKTLSRSALWAVALTLVLAPTLAAETLDSHTVKTFKAIPGGTVSVDVSFHDVDVEVKERSDVEITVDLKVRASASKARDLLEDYAPKFSERDSTIAVKSTRKGGISFNWFGSSKIEGRVKVVMPPGMSLTLDTASGDCEVGGDDLGEVRLAVDTASGEVTVAGAADEIVVDTASGDVQLDLDRPARSVNVDTASGEVWLRGGAAELRVDTASGDVSAVGLTGSANVDTASGGVKAQWDSIPGGVRVIADTASGDVRLLLPAATVVDGKVSTTSGSIDSDFAGKSLDRGREYRFDGGIDAVTVKVDTASGDIEVLER